MEPAISINRPSNYDRITASTMPAILKLRKQEYEVQSCMTVRDAMLKHDIEPDVVIPTREGELIADNEVIHDGETIRLVPVISGGRPK
jgi:sulfur carrier protein ThiS